MTQLVKRISQKVLRCHLQLDNIIKVLRGTKAFSRCTDKSRPLSVSSFVPCQLLWSILCDCCGFFGLGCCQSYGSRKELQLSVCHIVYGFMLFCLLALDVGPVVAVVTVVAVGTGLVLLAVMHLYHTGISKATAPLGPA